MTVLHVVFQAIALSASLKKSVNVKPYLKLSSDE